MRDAPVTFLEAAAFRLRPGDIEAQQRHHVGLAGAQHALEGVDRLAQRLGIGRKGVPSPASDAIAQLMLGRLEVGPVGAHNVEPSVENHRQGFGEASNSPA